MTAHTARLDEVCEINPRMPKSLRDEDAVSFLSMAAVSEDGGINFEEERKFRDVKKGYTYFGRGDVLVAKITPCFENGKATRTESLIKSVGFGSTEFHVLRAGKMIDPSYLFHLVWNSKFREVGAANMTGSAGQKRVPADFLKRLEIPLPPLDEQRRIAAILDKADALRRKRKHALALLDTLTQSIFLEMFGDPATNPRNLQKIQLGDIIKVKSGDGLIAKDMVAGPYLVYGGNGINGYHDQFMFPEPKLVIGRVGVYCGAIHMTKPKSWITDNALYVSEFKRTISPIYLQYALMQANLNQYAGRAAQPLVSGSRIYPVEILLPDNEAQFDFESAMNLVDKLGSSLKRGLGAADTFFSSLQHRAFSGQL